jgi:hypothetical protein
MKESKKTKSKKYKKYKDNYESKSKGVGDTVAKITKVTGIEKAVKFLAGEDCGCDERKKVLNHIFPYQKPLCFTENEYIYLTKRIKKINKVTVEEQKELLSIYNRVFKDNRELTSCSSCFLNGVWKKLERLYKEYE